MPLHIFYSSGEISRTSMTRASVSSLVGRSGAKWLWVHAVLLWWVTLTWTATILWVTWGGLAYRRREIKRLEERVKESRAKHQRVEAGETGIQEADGWSVADDSEGIKRFRTLMVTNVPPDSESTPGVAETSARRTGLARLLRSLYPSTSSPYGSGQAAEVGTGRRRVKRGYEVAANRF